MFYPIKNYQGAKSERWAYVHFIGGAANYPIIYPAITHLRFTPRSLQWAYLRIFISETSTNKKYEEKMHIEVSETIFYRLLQ